MRKSRGKKVKPNGVEEVADDEPLATGNDQSGSDDDEYEVEKIVGKRKKKGKTEYLVRWKGFSESADTWEGDDNLTCPELIAAFNESEQDDEKPLVSKGKGKKRGKGRPKKSDAKKRKKEESEDEDAASDPEKEYEVERVLEVHFKKNGNREFLVRWKGYSKKDDTWEPEENLNCDELITAFMAKVEKAKETTVRETRVNRNKTDRFVVDAKVTGRKNRSRGARRTYYEED